MPQTANVEEFLLQLGDFYEMVDDGAADRMSTQRSKMSLMNNNLSNGISSLHSASISDSSPETLDTLHSQPDCSSQILAGLLCHICNIYSFVCLFICINCHIYGT